MLRIKVPVTPLLKRHACACLFFVFPHRGLGAGAAFPELPSPLQPQGEGSDGRIDTCLLNSPAIREFSYTHPHGPIAASSPPASSSSLVGVNGRLPPAAQVVHVPRGLILKKTTRLWCWCQLPSGHPRSLFPLGFCHWGHREAEVPRLHPAPNPGAQKDFRWDVGPGGTGSLGSLQGC